jgi:cell wall-associated NlpC family hydrolase
MLHGIISVPVTDLRTKPDENSERVSQALFGTPVEIGEVQKKFMQIALPDKYSGWCRTGHIHQVSFALWRKYVAAPKHVVKAESVLIKGAKGAAAYPYRLYFGTELALVQHNGEACFELPPGDNRAPISMRCLIARDEKKTRAVSGKTIVRTALRFLGVPYLWGGISPAGYDCSGLVQMVFRFHGIELPRDSIKQREEGQEVKRDELKAGDLLFFPGHVALSGGGDMIIHAAASRGMVTVESLDPKAPTYRADLDKEFLIARRIQL